MSKAYGCLDLSWVGAGGDEYLLSFGVLNCANKLVQLISHSLGVHTTGGRFEVLFIGR